MGVPCCWEGCQKAGVLSIDQSLIERSSAAQQLGAEDTQPRTTTFTTAAKECAETSSPGGSLVYAVAQLLAAQPQSASRRSRTALAADVGVAVETLVAWETGRSSPRADTLAALAGRLACSIDGLFAPVNDEDPPVQGGSSCDNRAPGQTRDDAG